MWVEFDPETEQTTLELAARGLTRALDLIGDVHDGIPEGHRVTHTAVSERRGSNGHYMGRKLNVRVVVRRTNRNAVRPSPMWWKGRFSNDEGVALNRGGDE